MQLDCTDCTGVKCWFRKNNKSDDDDVLVNIKTISAEIHKENVKNESFNLFVNLKKCLLESFCHCICNYKDEGLIVNYDSKKSIMI